MRVGKTCRKFKWDLEGGFSHFWIVTGRTRKIQCYRVIAMHHSWGGNERKKYIYRYISQTKVPFVELIRR